MGTRLVLETKYVPVETLVYPKEGPKLKGTVVQDHFENRQSHATDILDEAQWMAHYLLDLSKRANLWKVYLAPTLSLKINQSAAIQEVVGQMKGLESEFREVGILDLREKPTHEQLLRKILQFLIDDKKDPDLNGWLSLGPSNLERFQAKIKQQEEKVREDSNLLQVSKAKQTTHRLSLQEEIKSDDELCAEIKILQEEKSKIKAGFFPSKEKKKQVIEKKVALSNQIAEVNEKLKTLRAQERGLQSELNQERFDVEGKERRCLIDEECLLLLQKKAQIAEKILKPTESGKSLLELIQEAIRAETVSLNVEIRRWSDMGSRMFELANRLMNQVRCVKEKPSAPENLGSVLCIIDEELRKNYQDLIDSPLPPVESLRSLLGYKPS